MKKKYHSQFLLFVTLFTFSVTVHASESIGTIDATSHSAKVCHDDACTTYGSINFLPSGAQAPVTITDTSVTGYAWGDEMGWINFAPTGTGVIVNPTTGELSGTAWSQSSGWINFRPANAGTLSGGIPIGVSITSTGEFYGWAWNGGAYGGWIKFDCTTALTCVKTDWRKVSNRTVVTSATTQQITSGGSYFITTTSAPTPSSPSSVLITRPTSPQYNGTENLSAGNSGSSDKGTTSLKLIITTLRLGMTSYDVKTLQIILSQDKEIYPSGFVTGYFGSDTKKAVEAFQIKYGIVKKGFVGYGEVGPKTRSKINELILAYNSSLSKKSNVTNEVSSENSSLLTSTTSKFLPISKFLRQGMSHKEVKTLQFVLAQDKEIYPTGLISGYFGSATKKAVEAFQVKYGIVKKGEEGYGEVGPKTRFKINELLKGVSQR